MEDSDLLTLLKVNPYKLKFLFSITDIYNKAMSRKS